MRHKIPWYTSIVLVLTLRARPKPLLANQHTTMKLEDQVCSLELSKRLKELGVKQSSFFHWDTKFSKLVWSAHSAAALCDFDIGSRYCSAFTVAELGEMLPGELSWVTFKTQRGWEWQYNDATRELPHNNDGKPSNTEADARAKMLIYLLENKLLTPPLK